LYRVIISLYTNHEVLSTKHATLYYKMRLASFLCLSASASTHAIFSHSLCTPSASPTSLRQQHSVQSQLWAELPSQVATVPHELPSLLRQHSIEESPNGKHDMVQ
uniref:Uncharacterized protein n=1 Tax=Fusarium oxysporum (strain Fo5176) TaxID=660025 RepID=A0A0D2Y7K1_FUSOF